MLLGRVEVERAVERLLALADAVEDRQAMAQHEVRFEQLGAEPLAGDLDLLREADFLVAREERDFAHLRQVDAHRVVNPRAGRRFDFLFPRAGLFGRLGRRRAAFDIRLVHQINAHLVELHQDLVNLLRRNGVVGQAVVELLVGEEPALLPALEQ